MSYIYNCKESEEDDIYLEPDDIDRDSETDLTYSEDNVAEEFNLSQISETSNTSCTSQNNSSTSINIKRFFNCHHKKQKENVQYVQKTSVYTLHQVI
ncbi:unnamed protein product [Gordionus sp. m RMFG-2023]